MKKIKLISVIMAIVMLFSFATVAFAKDANPGKITITNAVQGQTYTVYKLFDLDSFVKDNGDENKEPYCYLITDEWKDFFTTGEGSAFVTIGNGQEDNRMVTWKEGADAAGLAKLAIAYAKTNSIAFTGEKQANGTTLVFDNLPLGYYLVDSTVGTLCSLNTTDYDVEIKDKNEVPTVDKDVKEDATQTWEDTNDAAVGEIVEFKATITIAPGTAQLTLHDIMSAGLKFNNDVKIFLGQDDVTTNAMESVTDTSDGFDLVFKGSYIQGLDANTVLQVYYTATVDTDAVIGTEGNSNQVYLTYGENADLETSPKSETKTYVWKFDVYKYHQGLLAKEALAGAKFALYADAECTEQVKFVGDNNLYQHNASGTVSDFTTDDSGRFTLTGLDSGTYYLKEIAAPTGYNMLKEAVKVTIGANGAVAQDETPVSIVEVENKSGFVLPTTGGMGTVLFYIVGGFLILAAVVLLVTKKRMSNN